jgi:hypothetical protein
MMEESHRIDSIEERTRKVEEAIIGFEYIAKVILVQHENRLCSLEKHDEEIQAILYSSCDVKSKEIDDKLNVVAGSIRTQYDKYVTWGISIIAGLFFMMLGYVAYDQGQKANIGTALEARAVSSQENRTHIEVIHNTLDKIDSKLDRIFENQSTIISKGK